MAEILVRLRAYNPPDRTNDSERIIAQDIHDAADEIERLRLALAEATRGWDEARALAVSWEREFNVANHERLRLWDEAENLREKLGQFEAHGFPNVASVLDRIAALSRARETDGAVREAAEVRKHRTTLLSGLAYIARESWWPDDASVTDGVRDHVGKMRDAVDALSSPPCPAVLPLEAPECNDGDDCCRYCGRGLQPCGACKPPAPPADAATEAVNRLSPIATEPVARAAEIVRERLRIYGNTSTYLYDCPGLVAEVTDLLDALAAPAPAPAPSAKEGR